MTDRLPMAGQSQQIVNLNYLDREATLFKQSKETLNNNADEIQTAIDSNTTQEVREVEEAIQRLNKKVEQIINTDYIKQRKDKIEEAQAQMMKSMKEASNTFLKVRKVIQAKDHLSPEEKRQYEEKLFHKILDKFMTEEEKTLFTKIISAGPVLLLGGAGGDGGRISNMLGF